LVLLLPAFDCSALVRNPFNPQCLISHLTNSNECGNMQPKVLLTVSPFPPSLTQQLDLFPSSPGTVSPLATAFTPNRRLTPLSTAFTQRHRGGHPQLPFSAFTTHDDVFAPPLFSCSYKSLFPPARPSAPLFSGVYKSLGGQLLSLHIDANPRGCHTPLKWFFDSRRAGVRWSPSIKD
jgi:hypothetical protein